LKQKHRREKRVLLVGHEPYLSNLISLLLSGHTNICINLKKGGLCSLSIGELHYGRCADLESLLTPAQMRRLK
jgi:phosphohistidine phosphatase SixA